MGPCNIEEGRAKTLKRNLAWPRKLWSSRAAKVLKTQLSKVVGTFGAGSRKLIAVGKIYNRAVVNNGKATGHLKLEKGRAKFLKETWHGQESYGQAEQRMF